MCKFLVKANLASIRDAKNNKLLGTFTAGDFWVGGQESENGDWGWLDGSDWSYNHWNEGQPEKETKGIQKCVNFLRGMKLMRMSP